MNSLAEKTKSKCVSEEAVIRAIIREKEASATLHEEMQAIMSKLESDQVESRKRKQECRAELLRLLSTDLSTATLVAEPENYSFNLGSDYDIPVLGSPLANGTTIIQILSEFDFPLTEHERSEWVEVITHSTAPIFCIFLDQGGTFMALYSYKTAEVVRAVGKFSGQLTWETAVGMYKFESKSRSFKGSQLEDCPHLVLFNSELK